MFDENGNFRTLDYLSTILTCKANLLSEYHTLFKIFRKVVRKFDFSNAKYINIKKIHAFLFHNWFHSINNQKCKFFYEKLLDSGSIFKWGPVYLTPAFKMKVIYKMLSLIVSSII